MNDSYISSLPMYDPPSQREANDQLWRAIADRLRTDGIEAPRDRLRPADLAAHWRHDALLLSQGCGYPLLSLPDRVRVVATPRYTAPGCEGASYRSALVVRRDDPSDRLERFRDRRGAINGWDSNSGMNLLRAALAPLARGRRFLRDVLVTGSHAASLDAVADGRADLAAVDCVTLALLRRDRPHHAARIRVLGWTPASPGLPLITAAGPPVLAALRRALADVASDPALGSLREALLLDGFEVLPDDAYRAVAALEAEAIAAGYPFLP